jgi:hypothetical protein
MKTREYPPGVHSQLVALRQGHIPVTPLRLMTFLLRTGFKFEQGGAHHVIGRHPNHPAAIRIDLHRNPVVPFLASYALDLVEEILVMGEGR